LYYSLIKEEKTLFMDKIKRCSSFKRAACDGFTLIELLIVIAIIAILATAVIISVNPAELLAKCYWPC
jgi:prepilin-type N-terminal cleavage/methylation domain-containing protein